MSEVTRTHRNLLIATATATTLLIAMGGVVCSTNASGGCPDWPRCQGGLVPPLQANSVIEYSHRVIALLTALLVVASAIAGWRRKESGAALRVLPLVAIAFIVVVAAFGRAAVLTGLKPFAASIDLGSALIALSITVVTAVIASALHARTHLQWRRHGRSALWLLSAATLASFYAVIISGIFVARGSVMRCVGGPLHLGTWASVSDAAWLTTSRQALGVIAAALAAALVATALRSVDVDGVTRRWASAFGALFLAETALNAAMVSVGATAPLLVASVAATAAAWSALVVVAARARLVEPAEQPAGEARAILPA